MNLSRYVDMRLGGGAENAGLENTGVENAGAITYVERLFIFL